MGKQFVRTIELENDLTLQIIDQSRKIAADAQVVIMEARMEIPIEKSLFCTGSVTDDQFDHILKTLGSPLVYQYRAERNMIMDRDKEKVLEDLVETFLNNTGKYITRPLFPEKLVLKEYKERIEKKRL